jgi:lysyl-tRNA synthetase class 2
MASLDELRSVRLEKLNILKEFGMNPYPANVKRDFTLAQVAGDFKSLESTGKTIGIAGRVMSIRGQGAIIFVSLFDGTGNFQAVFKKDEIEEKLFKLFTDAVDIGDFIQVSGTLFVTKAEQESILVKEWTMLTKALLPLPDKWHGLQDVEETYRKRYLDILMDEEVRERFVTRAKIISYIRKFLDDKNFLEIETPTLQNQAGGAMAKVFETHHNDYDMDMVLRISLELEHKILTVGGYPRVYEIGKNFRNEGSDPTHIQEFTMLEWYAAYESLETNMEWTEQMLRGIANDLMGKSTFTVYDKEGNATDVDFSKDWPRVKFGDLLKENADIDMEKATIEDIKNKCIELGMDKAEMEKTGRGNLLDFIFKKSSRSKIINPTYVLDYPGDLKPLAQQNEDGTAKVAQLIIAGAEMTNQYAELVNPITQRELLEAQGRAKDKGDEEAMEVDERFLNAMEHGMPPMTGFGLGIDRFVAIMTNQKNLRDVIFFPIMRPKE